LGVGGAGKDDEAREVFVFGTETVGDPRADSGVAAEAVSSVELVAGGGVVDGVDLGAAVEADIIDSLLEVDPLSGDVGAAFSGFDEVEGALDEVAFAGGHGAFTLSAALESLEVSLGELGLGIEGIDVGRASLHHKEDAAFCTSGMVDDPRAGSLKHGGEGDGAEACAESVEGFAAGGVCVEVIEHGLNQGTKTRLS